MSAPPRLLSASAGTGKTWRVVQTLCEKLEQGARLEEVAAVTFTDAAAQELRERLRAELLARGREQDALRVDGAALCTIHTFCLLLRARHGILAGLRPDPLILEERQTRSLLREAVRGAVRDAEEGALVDLLAMSGEAMGLTERGFSDHDTPQGRLESLLQRSCEVARSVAMTPERLRAEAEHAEQRVLDALGPSGATELLLSRFEDALAEARAAVRRLVDPPTEKDRALFALLAVAETPAEELALRLACFDGGAASKKFAEGERAITAAQEYCRRHEAVKRRVGRYVRDLLLLAAEVLARFQRGKARHGAIDFEDMQLDALEMLQDGEGGASLAPLVAASLRLLVVDEFQDTSPLQFRLFEALREAGVETVYVGDLKQAIYGFRLADSSLFASLLEDARGRGAEPDRLDLNRRSTPAMVALLNDLLGPSLLSAGLEFEPARALPLAAPAPEGHTPLTLLRHAYREQGPTRGSARYTAARLLADTIAGKEPFLRDRETGQWRALRQSDIAILARKHSQLDDWAEALSSVGLTPAYAQGGLYSTLEVRLLRAWLRMCSSARDTASCAMVLLSELYGLRQRTVARLAADGLVGAPGRALQVLGAQEDTLTPFERRALERAERELTHARALLRRRPLTEALEEVLQHGEFVERLTVGRSEARRREARANVGRVLELAEGLSREGERALLLSERHGATLEALLRQLDVEAESDPGLRPAGEGDQVQLMTLHRSKGLEFPVVVLDALREELGVQLPRVEVHRPPELSPGRDQDWLYRCGLRVLPESRVRPLRESLEQAHDAEAEATREWLRLLYVGATRARDHLVLLWPDAPKTPSTTRVARDLLAPSVSSVPSAAGRTEWPLASRSHAIRVLHATAPPESARAAPQEPAPMEALRALVDATLGATFPAEPPAAAALEGGRAVFSVSELAAVDACPMVPLLRLRNPGLHAEVPLAAAPVKVLPLAKMPPAPAAASTLGTAWGTWAHSLLERWLPRWPQRPGAEELLAATLSLELGDEREAAAQWLHGATEAVFHALTALRVEQVVGAEVPFLVSVGGLAVRGTMDLVARNTEGLCVVDYKSGLGAAGDAPTIPSAYELQLALYGHALEALGAGRVAGLHLLVLARGELRTLSHPPSAESLRARVLRSAAASGRVPEGPWNAARCEGCGWRAHCPAAPGALTP